MTKKNPEPKITFVENGKIQLNIRVPNIFPKNISHIVRDIRKTLENCAALNLLDEFAETRTVEYEEVKMGAGHKEKIVNNLVPHNSDIPEDEKWKKRWESIYIAEVAK